MVKYICKPNTDGRTIVFFKAASIVIIVVQLVFDDFKI